jgi:hypothetical protein
MAAVPFSHVVISACRIAKGPGGGCKSSYCISLHIYFLVCISGCARDHRPPKQRSTELQSILLTYLSRWRYLVPLSPSEVQPLLSLTIIKQRACLLHGLIYYQTRRILSSEVAPAIDEHQSDAGSDSSTVGLVPVGQRTHRHDKTISRL